MSYTTDVSGFTNRGREEEEGAFFEGGFGSVKGRFLVGLVL